MADRADAHLHFFKGSFRGSFTDRKGVNIDEPALYGSLAEEHAVKQALVVCYEGEDWAKGNNAHVARLAADHAWIRPVAFIDPADAPALHDLEQYRRDRFVGISFYIFKDAKVEALGKLPDEFWSWLEAHHWLISVNSKGKPLNAWLPILEKHADLRILISHLGLPPRAARPPGGDEARKAMADVTALARFEKVHVKLSGFYALSDPGHDYPHRAAWPYLETLKDAFGTKRLVWGSDFTPSMDWLSFPQTFGLFSHMPFLTNDDRQHIEGLNLEAVLAQVS